MEKMASQRENDVLSADIRANAQGWSLEGDAKLLDFMKRLSKKIEDRGNETTRNLFKMQLDLDRANVALGNTTNRLMSLQHSQFVENRVYDDDETCGSATHHTYNSQISTEKAPRLVDALQHAFKSGVEILDKYYEKVTVELSDESEDEVDDACQDNERVIFRPKNPYINRPLPYVIGSKDWQEKWHIGLDSDRETSDNEPIDEMSESSSSSSIVSLHSHIPASMSESDHSVWGIDATAGVSVTGPQKKVVPDIFNASSEEDKGNNNIETALPTSNSTHVLGDSRPIDKLPHNVREIKNQTGNSIFRQPSSTHGRAIVENLFDSEPPEIDESPTSTHTTDRKPVNLFLDDDFDDDGFDIFTAKKDDSQKSTDNGAKVNREAIRSINLFEDDDDVLFDSSPVLKRKSESSTSSGMGKNSILSSVPLQKKLFPNLFDDEPPEDDFDFLTKPSTIAIDKPKQVAGARGLEVTPNRTETCPMPGKSDISHEQSPNLSLNAVKEKVQPRELKSQINLFDDGDDDSAEVLTAFEDESPSSKRVDSHISSDISSEIDKNEHQIVEFKEETRRTSAAVLDDDSVLVESKVIDAIEKPPSLSVNLFGDDLDTDDHFTNPPSKKVDEKVSISYASPQLFDDVPPDDDDFATTRAQAEIKPSGLGEFYNDFSETVTLASKESAKSQYSYLFNDEPPPDDDLFQTIKPKKTVVSDPEFSKKLNIFAGSTKLVDEQPKETQVKNKPKKLNIRSFDINVSALLPGAKRTVGTIKNNNIASPSDENKDDNKDHIKNDMKDEIQSVSPPTSPSHTDNAGRLSNLTRNRAKMQMRRPSTRRGRQQQYKKSLEIAEETEAHASEEIFSEVVENKKDQNNVIRRSVEPEVEHHVPVTKDPDMTFLDDRDNSDDDDWLSSVTATPAKTTSKLVIEANDNVHTSAFKADTLVFKDTNLNKMDGSEASYSEQPPPLSPSTQLFDDFEKSDDESSIFASHPQSNSHTEKKSGFHRVQKKPSNSLFDDEDENEDDLFGFPPARSGTTGVIDPPQPLAAAVGKKSLFGDESSDEDDFLFASKSAVKRTDPKSISDENATVLNRKEVSPGKLFSDSDDDDDDVLFGSKANVSTAVRKPSASSATQNRITKAKTAPVTNQNPLADLLE